MDQIDPVDPRRFVACHRLDELARGVEDLELDRPEEVPGALVIGDDGAPRRIAPDEARVALDPPAVRGHPLLHGPARKERRLARHDFRGQVPQRRQIVDDPDAPAVRREDEVVVARMHLQVTHRHAREVASLELAPRLPRVGGDPEPELGAEEEQVLAHGVFLDDVRVSANTLLR